LSIAETSTHLTDHNVIPPPNFAGEKFVSGETKTDINEITFKLGLWLSGLESFLNLRSSTLVEENPTSSDWSKEFRLTHSVLLLCSKLSLDLSRAIRMEMDSDFEDVEIKILDNLKTPEKKVHFSSDEVFELINALKESVLLSEGLIRAAPLNFSEWRAWSNSLADRLKSVNVVDNLIKFSEQEGEQFLPEKFQELLLKEDAPVELIADLRLVLPHFAKILKWLSVVGKMLRNDEPLKNSLLLFARVNEQMQEMMNYINNRLLRFQDEEDALFGSLDGAAYTASIELRKVYNQELKGLAEVRPTPVIYAKIETSYSLLNDSLQLTLVNFAQLIDRDVEPIDIFPNLQTKEEQSIELRDNMWKMLQSVKEAEQNPENQSIEELHDKLVDFRDRNLYFLFYKDMETVDRFIEEVLVTKNKKDLVPILHRFGAYLETLLGQVNMLAVLANHPFQPLQRETHEMFV
jgi:hypothetical protein